MADYIPDSVTVLQNGTGTPYLGIFNGMAKPIMDPKYNLPIGMYVTSFEYVYDEEDCDEATIHLDCDNPDLVDLNDLQYYRPIQLQWGYIYPSNVTYQGPVRKVIIIGREVSFDETGTHITLTMGDATTILKNSPANYYNNTKGLLAYLVDITKEIPIGYTLSDYKETTIKSQVVAKKTIPEEELIAREYYYRSKYGTNTGPTENIPWVFPGMMDTGRVNLLTGEVGKTNLNVFKGYLEEGLPSVIPEGLVAMTLLEANEGNIKFAEQFPEWARLVDIEIGGAYNLAILGVSTNKYNQLGEIFRWAKNGPYFLDGRDNMLNIHNQLTNRPISKVYTYAGGNGELLEFRVSSEYTISVVGVTKTTEIGPDKTIKETMTQVVNVDDAPGKWDRENTVFGIWPEGSEHNLQNGQRNFWGNIIAVVGICHTISVLCRIVLISGVNL